jgi:hypothetical protein
MDTFFQVLRGNDAPIQTPTDTITKLCDRAMHSTLLEDRRGAVQGLRSLAREWKLDVGTKGMPALLNILKTDRMDIEIIKSTLETLNTLCSTTGDGDDDLGAMLTEIFLKVIVL